MEKSGGVKTLLPSSLDRPELAIDDDPPPWHGGSPDRQSPDRRGAPGPASRRCHADPHRVIGCVEDAG
jgi:hypothetical protein